MATWVDEYMTMVNDCEKRESRLTEWEQEFIDSIRHWLEDERPLTPKQTELWRAEHRDGKLYLSETKSGKPRMVPLPVRVWSIRRELGLPPLIGLPGLRQRGDQQTR